MKISLGLTTTYEAFLVINVIRRLRVPGRQNSPVNGIRTVSRRGRATALKRKARKRRSRRARERAFKMPGTPRSLTTSVSLKYSGRFPPPVATADRYIKPSDGIGGCRESSMKPRRRCFFGTCMRVCVRNSSYRPGHITRSLVCPVYFADSLRRAVTSDSCPRLKFDKTISPTVVERRESLSLFSLLSFSHINSSYCSILLLFLI